MMFDLNHDGVVDYRDNPYPPGSEKAKAWWAQVDAKSKEDGEFNGHPLRPGAHQGDGDFEFLVNKLMVDKGLSHESAMKIAGKVNANLYR